MRPNSGKVVMQRHRHWLSMLLCACIVCHAVDVHTVHLTFSHHLDVGLDLPGKEVANCVGFATKIVQRYFDEFIPRAIRLARETSRNGSSARRFRYQIHPWIGSLYADCVPWSVSDGCRLNPGVLRCPNETAVAQFGEALKRGDLVFAASPFNINAEAVGEPSLFSDLIGIASSLESRFGVRKPQLAQTNTSVSKPELANSQVHRSGAARVWSNVDVKGFARSAIPLMAKAGVSHLYVGTNGEPKSPQEALGRGLQPICGTANATMFRWQDPPSGEEIVVLYVSGYGSYIQQNTAAPFLQRNSSIISPNGIALVSYFANDNAGPPQSTAEIDAIHARVAAVFPNATIRASSFDEFVAEALTPDVIEQLPVTSQDWGDQWLTGMSTDATRLAKYRAIARARAACVASGEPLCDPTLPQMRNLTRWLAKFAEHTQGVQNEDWSPGIAGPLQKQLADKSHWSNAQFGLVHNAKRNKFAMGDLSWIEARAFNSLAVGALPAQHPLGRRIRDELAQLVPRKPSMVALHDIPDPTRPITCADATIAFNMHGSVRELDFGTGARWASNSSTLVELTYVTYNKQEPWDTRQNMSCAEPGCANPEDRVWRPRLVAVRSNGTADVSARDRACHIVVELEFAEEASAKYGAPSRAFATYTIKPSLRSAAVALTWFNKSTTRLPESLMLAFRPPRQDGFAWAMDILGSWVRPDEVLGKGGTNQLQRGVWNGVRYTRANGTAHVGLAIDSLDAGMTCPVVPSLGLLGDSTPIGEGNKQAAILSPDLVEGMAFSLQQNLMPISGFAQWYPFGVGDAYQAQDEAALFRFELRDVGITSHSDTRL